MNIFANDFYGLPLHIGDSVVSVDGSELGGEILDIYEAEDCLWLTIGLQKDLNPESFTTQERFPNH